MRNYLLLILGLITCSAIAQVLPGKAVLTPSHLSKYQVHYYPFTGNANDESGNNHHGTVSGATLDLDRFNNPQSSYRFNGSSYIQFPIDTNCEWNDYTFMAWTKLEYNQINISQNRHILSIGNSQEAVGLIQYPPSMNIIYQQGMYYNTNVTSSEFSTLQGWYHGASFDAYSWRHYSFVMDSTQHSYSCYMNGNYGGGYIAPSPFSPIHLGNKTAKVGCRFDNIYYFNGLVDEIRIFCKALDACEIKAVMNAKTCTDSLCENSPNSVYFAMIENASSYNWNIFPPGAATITSQGDSCIVDWNNSWTGTATLVVSGQNTNGAGTPDSINIFVKPAAPGPVITKNLDTLISSIATGNQWHYNNAPIPGATNQKYLATQTGAYYTVVNSTGCTKDTSAIIDIVFHTGIINAGPDDSFSVFPNPSNGLFIIQSDEIPASVEIANLLGEIVYVTPNKVPLKTLHINLENKPKGLYFYRATFEDEKTTTGKIIIE